MRWRMVSNAVLAVWAPDYRLDFGRLKMHIAPLFRGALEALRNTDF